MNKAYLEHLNEGDAEVHVREVAADQTQTKEESNGDNSPEVDTTSHRNGVSRVQQVRATRNDLGHDGRESEMPCCEENCYSSLSARARLVLRK